MKILVTLPWMPFPLSDGGKQGSFNMLEALQDKLNIVLTYPVFDKKQLKYEKVLFSRLNKVTIYPFLYFRNKGSIKSQYFMFRLHRFITKKILKEPYLATPVYQKEYLDHVLEVIQKEKIDIIQNEYYEQLFLVYALPKGIKRIFIQHEIHYINKQRNINQLNPCPSDIFSLYNKIKQEEISAMNQYDMIVTMTDIDKRIIIQDGVTVPVYSSPSFIPLIESSQFIPCNKQIISFVGGSAHYPNLNGIMWFLKKVWPIVLKSSPTMQLQIIGKWSDKDRAKLAYFSKNVIFRGFVPNLGEAISGTIMVVPILIGSGIRMKILEAVNYFSPFVATTVGAEGLSFESEKECIITDKPEAFAKAILEIQGSEKKQQTLAKNAYNKLKCKYSALALSEKRYNLYKLCRS